MTDGLWTPLRRELRTWVKIGLRLPVWWRDDDAIEPTPQLDRLRLLAEDFGLPVHLAIVPAHAKPELGPWLRDGPFRGVVHGWSHRNHAPPGTKSSEFGTPRADAVEDAAHALRHLRQLFDADVHPMFVPPWNRIDPGLLPGLPAVGYRAVSTFGPRKSAEATPGLAQINTHVDPVDWHGTRGLADPEKVLGKLVAHLQARRDRQADRTEPLGLLTHHLMMDHSTWDFCRGLLLELQEGPMERFDFADEKRLA